MVNCKACFATVPSSILSVHLHVTPAVPYLPTGLAGCSVGPEISCDAHKLVRTSRVIKKKRHHLHMHWQGIISLTQDKLSLSHELIYKKMKFKRKLEPNRPGTPLGAGLGWCWALTQHLSLNMQFKPTRY